MKKLDMANLKGDIFGGLTAGVVALPLALAFGVASGLGAIAGLYGAIAVGIFAAIFGGTPAQVSGPTGPMTVVAAAIIASQTTATGEPNLPLILGTFSLAGLLQILLGVARVGAYIRYIPYPVISGFMTGIGVIIILLQLFPLFGRPSPSSNPLDILLNLHRLLEGVSPAAAMVGFATIALIYTLPRFTKALPAPLAALIIVSTGAFFLKLDVSVIGDIPRGLPSLHLPAVGWGELPIMIIPAIQLALLGTIDSLLTSLVADKITRTRHDSNRELVGQGIGNVVSGLIGGIPGAGATMRTVVNVNAGGRSRLSGTIHGLFLIGVLLGGASLVQHIPTAVLAGILMTVGIGIIDYRGFRHLAQVPRSDAFLMVFVLLLTVFKDLIMAVAAGVIMASFAFIKKVSDIAERKTRFAGLLEEPWADEQQLPAQVRGKVLIKHVEGPLFFGFASGFQRMSEQLNDVRVVILRLDRVSYIDQTGLYALEETIHAFRNRGVRVMIAGILQQHLDLLRKVDIVPRLVAEEDIFVDFDHLREKLPEALSLPADLTMA